jgi:hypothetical protein
MSVGMTTIYLDDAAGAMSIRDIFTQAKGEIIEFRDSAGDLVGTLTLTRPPTEEEYSRFIAETEADIDELRRRCESTQWFTTAEVFAKLLQLSEKERK